MGTRTAIYARISDDREGRGLGVERQRKDCVDLAQGFGWDVAEVFIDNDISAYSGKTRPQYQALCKAIENHEIDAVIAWHPDRLHRSPKELEVFIDLVEKAEVQIHTVKAGHFDLNTPTGRMIARIVGSTARYESEHKSERGVSKQRELAMTGKYAGGSTRPFGYEKDGKTVKQDEAVIIRNLVDRYLVGESLSSLCRWLNASEIASVGGGDWRTRTLKTILNSGRISGQREYKGEIVGEAEWEAIIPRELGEQVRIRMKLAHPQGVAPARRYLLSGLLKCSRCGEKLFSAPSHERRTYRCNKGVANRGCGQCFIWSDPIELFICEMLLQRLESPEFQKLLQERGHEDAEVTKAEKTLIFARGRGDEIALMLAQGELSRSQFHTAQGEITRTIESAQKVILNSTQPITIATLGESGEEIRFRFWGLNLDRQRAIVKMVLSHIVIDAESRVAFHPDRVEPHWLL